METKEGEQRKASNLPKSVNPGDGEKARKIPAAKFSRWGSGIYMHSEISTCMPRSQNGRG